MPRLDLVLLPLLGGYIFLITFNHTKFYHQRIEKNRLLYNSLLVGFILVSIVYILDFLFLRNNDLVFSLCTIESNSVKYYRNFISQKIDEIINVRKDGFKQSMVALLIAYPAARLLNKIKYFKEDFSFDYALNKWGNEYDKIIWNALGQKEDLDKLLMLTTKTNKVYIGQVTMQSKPIESTHIRIIPSLSGYRNKDTHEVTIVNNYSNVIGKLVEEDKQDKIDKLGIIVPISEIVLISKFDHELFGRFVRSSNSIIVR